MSRGRSIAGALNAALAFLVGLAIWLPSLLVFTGAPVLGRGIEGWEKVSYFAPVVLVVVPVLMRMMARGHRGRAMWLAAVAPLLGLAGSFCALLIEQMLLGSSYTYSTASTVVPALGTVAVSAAIGAALWLIARKRGGREAGSP